jgi:hypothetical protein
MLHSFHLVRLRAESVAVEVSAATGAGPGMPVLKLASVALANSVWDFSSAA